jgi:hypothetical protein
LKDHITIRSLCVYNRSRQLPLSLYSLIAQLQQAALTLLHSLMPQQLDHSTAAAGSRLHLLLITA